MWQKSRVLNDEYELVDNADSYLYEIEFEFEVPYDEPELYSEYGYYIDDTMKSTKMYPVVSFYVKREDTELIDVLKNYIEPITLDSIQYLRITKEIKVSDRVKEEETEIEVYDKEQIKNIISKVNEDVEDSKEYYGVYSINSIGYPTYLGTINSL